MIFGGRRYTFAKPFAGRSRRLGHGDASEFIILATDQDRGRSCNCDAEEGHRALPGLRAGAEHAGLCNVGLAAVWLDFGGATGEGGRSPRQAGGGA